MDLALLLAELTPQELAETVERAKAVRTTERTALVPAEKIARFKELARLLDLGEDRSFLFSLPLRLKVNIGTEGGSFSFGHIRTWTLELADGASRMAQRFFERYMDGAMDVIREDSTGLETLPEADLGPSLDWQTQQRSEFDSLRRDLAQTYEIDPWKLLEDKK